ncbi:hypothetical protein ABER90_16895 [Bacillus paranthracis]|uniref:SEC-C motif-containing protein n=1 Tax=Bacillus wiedmannii TaxID=1890302 RepID=A0AA95LT75_9BACI|nr:hypothetical protein [Bacillus wiedmannii]WHY28324.1 hypothetical protein QNH45_22965 [Bacillus wiedmannii]
MIMMEFSPNPADIPPFESDFWAELLEDETNRALSIKLYTDGNTQKAPYIMRLKFDARGTVKFKIEASPYASALAYHRWHTISKKMKKLEYRRTYVLNATDDVIFTSVCPDIDNVPDKFTDDVYRELAKIEEKFGSEITGLESIKPSLLSKLRELNVNWEEYSKESRNSQIEQLIREFSFPKLTIFSVELRMAKTMIVPMMIMELPNWINYTQFGLNFEEASKELEWKTLVKMQGEIKIVCNARTFPPDLFFREMMNMRTEGEYYVLNMIENLMQFASEELPTLKTNIQIEFFEPIGRIQEVKVVIQDVDQDYNVMENLLMQEKYVEAIPYLEKLTVRSENLAYAYALNKQYDKAISLADEIIQHDKKTVAHMTKGLALVGKRDFNAAFEAYQLGVHICPYNWYPIAKDNLEAFIKEHNISISEEVEEIIELLNRKRNVLAPKQKCFCKSGKKFKRCHGK